MTVLIQRTAHCQCGHPIFFRNHLCLHCGRALGFDPDQATIMSLEARDDDSNVATWRGAGASVAGRVYRRCANFSLAPQCNWLVLQSEGVHQELCRCCRLNRTVPDQSIAANALLWNKVEIAKRRLVSSLIALGLPVASRVSEDTQQGLAFDLLVGAEPAAITTGHEQGIITINVTEADDVTRETIRNAMNEPYRTLLGHVRHESGHYYWSRLLDGSRWHDPFRTLFGDERQDYTTALQNYYCHGPALDWDNTCVSAYACAHPWEDWAETWAHYLHMVDTLDTATGFGIADNHLSLLQDPFDESVLCCNDQEQVRPDQKFLSFVNRWSGLTSVLNEFSLGMGLPDFYPFVLSSGAVTKLHFVHRFIEAFSDSTTPPAAAT
jgi:hypothetical protein